MQPHHHSDTTRRVAITDARSLLPEVQTCTYAGTLHSNSTGITPKQPPQQPIPSYVACSSKEGAAAHRARPRTPGRATPPGRARARPRRGDPADREHPPSATKRDRLTDWAMRQTSTPGDHSQRSPRPRSRRPGPASSASRQQRSTSRRRAPPPLRTIGRGVYTSMRLQEERLAYIRRACKRVGVRVIRERPAPEFVGCAAATVPSGSVLSREARHGAFRPPRARGGKRSVRRHQGSSREASAVGGHS